MDVLFNVVGIVVYVALGLLALWGAFCAVLVWRRVGQVRFDDEDEQDEFLAELDASLGQGNYSAAAQLCEDDRRALPQLALFAIENRELGITKLQRRLWERFQQDVLADIEHRLSWVATVVKSAPMVGLFGTVLGMMGAFRGIATGGSDVDPTAMAGNIMLALITTACGLAIAVPLLLVTNSIVVRIRKMEDLVGLGIGRLIDSLKLAFARSK
ncbi:MotA/TolQ/ExbB proton channel family protein [Aeoliella sp. ICT_H6.2]|uniref:MotA/TolQ/ExbB proton channel family protein n=1 Tax=Aeoliella straminimaris TaxID=2954799 RepID=A0A9X2FAM5_9BACT|nr:MotA/TolQ/ExbB proton channel family protein [Aeoliella straminimaris]MCO6044708.1 MotA/TolQ/ExbB proton channel family protein [Aeoliella straminimaris]